MSSRGARLRIEVHLQDSQGWADFWPVNGPRRRFEILLGRAHLPAEIAALRCDLDKLVRMLGDRLEIRDAGAVRQGFTLLRNRGLNLAFRLFGRRIKEVSDLFRSACPLWQRFADVPPPLVELKGSTRELLPIEFLPLFDTGPIGEGRGEFEPFELAGRFVGFSCFVCRRIARTPLPQDRILENRARLPLKFFYHAGLRGAQREVEFFRSQSRLVDFQGPWPDRILEEANFRQGLASFLVNPSLAFDSLDLRPADQIQHFACHCGSDPVAAEDDFLILAHHKRSERRVTVRTLELALAEYLGNQADARPPLPLVFVNSCRSAIGESNQVASFEHFFVGQNGNRGFIGTQSWIPDQVASTFSSYFYSRLLDGLPLSTAIHESRWQLLKRYRNPLGLLYTVHADPEIRVHTPARAGSGDQAVTGVH